MKIAAHQSKAIYGGRKKVIQIIVQVLKSTDADMTLIQLTENPIIRSSGLVILQDS